MDFLESVKYRNHTESWAAEWAIDTIRRLPLLRLSNPQVQVLQVRRWENPWLGRLWILSGSRKKKTINVKTKGVSPDVVNKKVETSTGKPRFQYITPRLGLITKQNFRASIDNVDNLDQIDDQPVHSAYPLSFNRYEVTNPSSFGPRLLLTPLITDPYNGYVA